MGNLQAAVNLPCEQYPFRFLSLSEMSLCFYPDPRDTHNSLNALSIHFFLYCFVSHRSSKDMEMQDLSFRLSTVNILHEH